MTVASNVAAVLVSAAVGYGAAQIPVGTPTINPESANFIAIQPSGPCRDDGTGHPVAGKPGECWNTYWSLPVPSPAPGFPAADCQQKIVTDSAEACAVRCMIQKQVVTRCAEKYGVEVNPAPDPNCPPCP